MAEAMEFEFSLPSEEAQEDKTVKETFTHELKIKLPEVSNESFTITTPVKKEDLHIFSNPSKELDKIMHTYNHGKISFPKTLSVPTLVNTDPLKIHGNEWLTTKPKEPKRKPRLLKGMVMTLKGEDTINISFKGDYYAVTPTTLRLMKGGKPTLIWNYLVLLCKNKGVINFPYLYGNKYFVEKDKYQARLKRLRQLLESEFDVKIKRGRDYNYHNVFEFKSIVFRDEFTPQHEQYLKQQEEDRVITDVTYSAMDSIKKNKFHSTELEDEENIQQNF